MLKFYYTLIDSSYYMVNTYGQIIIDLIARILITF